MAVVGRILIYRPIFTLSRGDQRSQGGNPAIGGGFTGHHGINVALELR